MPRSHPPTLFTLVSRTLGEECGEVTGKKLLVGVSGGPDSMALLHVLSMLRKRFDLGLVSVLVDHGLRDEAGLELDKAEAFSKDLDVQVERRRVHVSPGANLQARARRARYQVFRETLEAHRANLMVTAHHADDRAETVLLRLMRGAGPRGLSVLLPRSGRLLRPMIRARRTDVMSHIERHQVPYSCDPSNQNPRFLRVRVRRELLPLMSELSPQVTAHLCALSDQLAATEAGPSESLDPLGDHVLEDTEALPALNRAQLDQIQRALALGRSNLEILLEGGRAMHLQITGGDGLNRARGRAKGRLPR